MRLDKFRTAGVLAGLLVALAGCGVPTSGKATPVPSEQVPFGLLSPGAAAPAPHPSTRPSRFGALPTVYFLRNDKLLGSPVPRAAADPHAALVQLVAALSAGPTSEQRAAGLDSALPQGLRLAVHDLTNGVATIDLQGEGSAKVGDQGPLAVGQIVLTATSVPEVDSVLLTRQGKSVEAQLAAGELTDQPLTPDEYLSLVAPR